jgi:hypothetical protein
MVMGFFGSIFQVVYIVFAFSDTETPFLHWTLSICGLIIIWSIYLAESLVLEIFIPGSKGVLTKQRIRYFQYAAIVSFFLELVIVIWIIPYVGSVFAQPLKTLWQLCTPVTAGLVILVDFVVTRYILYRITSLMTPVVGIEHHEYDKDGLRRLYWVSF